MKRTLQIASLLCLLPAAPAAQAHSEGYLYDSWGSIVRTGYGGCVRTAEWTAGNAVRECDPDLFKTAAAPASPATATPVAAPVSKPAALKLELSADALFELNKAELKPEAKTKLGKLAKELRGLDYDKIIIIGHADRTGSQAGNQRLSERRANAVHNFLVSEGVASGKMDSSGAGSSQPVTKATDCTRLKNKQLAACLAPDRRVEISVAGTHSK